MKQILIIILFVIAIYTDDFSDFKSQMQTKVNGLASEMQTIFGRRCQSSIANCQTLSYDLCQGTSGKHCIGDFPTPDGCFGNGAHLSTQSAVRFPNDVDTNNLSAQQKQFICTSALMENKFVELDTGRDYRYATAYIGTSLGSFRAYPTIRSYDDSLGTCSDYDPRFRPWYVTATSGAKNVILLIDTSGSMYGSRLTILKDAATAVVNTLSNNDFVAVIQFASSAQYVHSSTITRATSSQKQSFISAIDALDATGQTNYQAAFRLGFDYLNAATSDEYGAPCSNGQNIFLFLTDGQPTVGLSTSSDLINLINGYSQTITLFTYALGSGANTSILVDLACNYRGIMFQIEDTASDSALTTTMRNYYSYISEGVTITQPVWTEPYWDAFGFGYMVTVSKPIYYQQSGIRQILGVAGIDITFDQISFGQTQQQVISRLITNAPCQVSTLTQCEIQQFRGSNTCSGVTGCNATSNISACNETASTIFTTTDADIGTYICCGLTVAAFIGIIVGCVALVLIIVIIICCKYRAAKAKRQAMQAANNQNIENSNNNVNPPPKQKKQQINQQQIYPNPNPYININQNQNNPYQKQSPNNPYFNQGAQGYGY